MTNSKYPYHESLKKYLQELFTKTRKEHNLTQEQMAESLHIALRNYQKLESGKTMCSAETMLLFWVTYTNIDTGYKIRKDVEKILANQKYQYIQTL